ncbi:MAG: hypothetical protein KAJ86_07795 [Alphaproteobacteria bacterium]|nr:hypothetical protein [Alphaproteobacteria bacterium]
MAKLSKLVNGFFSTAIVAGLSLMTSFPAVAGGNEQQPTTSTVEATQDAKTPVDISKIKVPRVDLRKSDLTQEAIEEFVKIKTYKGDNIALLFLCNGTSSTERDPFNSNYDADDGKAWKEIKAAAQKIMAEDLPLYGIVIAESKTGKDEVILYMKGMERCDFKLVTAGHGGMTNTLVKNTLTLWKECQDFEERQKDKLAMNISPST